MLAGGRPVGHVTSGTRVPYWIFSDEGILSRPTGERGMRSIALAYVDADLEEGAAWRSGREERRFEGVIVERHLSGEAPPYVASHPGPEERTEESPSHGRA